MTRVLIEACVGSAADAVEAERAGADRIELNRDLELDGLTPGVQEVRAAVASVAVPVIAMIRPHNRGYVYSADEFDRMLSELDQVLDAGATGIAMGVLTADARVDRVRTLSMVRRAKGSPVVFHRAFDAVADPVTALEELIDVGVTRILTSGLAATALQGVHLISSLVERSAGRIEILPGAGVSPDNASTLVRVTNCTQLHGSFRGPDGRLDPRLLIATRMALGAPDPES